MAQMALSYAIDSAQTLALNYASQALSAALAPRGPDGPRLSELAIQTSTEGQFIPILYGRMRLAGQVIWAARFKEYVTKADRPGKGGGGARQYTYSLSFAVGLCEGEIAGIGRIWANGQELDQTELVYRVHTGTPDQAPDPLIAAIEGAAPAYRDLAYVVFEDLPLDPFGQRIPNLSFEVIARTKASEEVPLEDLIEGVCLIPASGEFSYATTPVLRDLRPGEALSENQHSSRGVDVLASLDDLEARLPKCRSVALVVAWFGTDLRCEACQLKPGIEVRLKTTQGVEWGVAGLNRDNAYLVSQKEGRPAYGGTPSDDSVKALIGELKSRGFQVTFYPFILMDIPDGNRLPGLSGGVGQPAFPWRGRIASVATDRTRAVADFFGSDHDFRYRHFIQHYARLVAEAGGVDTFVIGSEMVALNQIRTTAGDHPAVTAFQTLAGDVRAILGSTTTLTYAADWTEYAGYSPAQGDKAFHLDPLWADPNIDCVALDWYIPLADQRDNHLPTLEDMHAHIEGGEGFEWYYKTSEDREAGLRSPIEDGAYGEAWIWRYKDLRSWWSQRHFERTQGVRASTPTAWQPRSKPLRFMEMGCPAIDKGANQPNVFVDPKSSESTRPYFSTGGRDDAVQRRYLSALISYWRTHNPVSPVYGAPMVDLAHSHVWCWDARPFPAFPSLNEIWSDGPNWQVGHWLNGRVGQSPLGAIVRDLAARAGLESLDVSQLNAPCAGYILDHPQSARQALAGLSELYGFQILDRSDGPIALPDQLNPSRALSYEQLSTQVSGPQAVRLAQTDRVEEVRLTLIEDGPDYRPLSVYARGDEARVEGVKRMSLAVLGDEALGKAWSQTALSRAKGGEAGLRLAIPPSQMALEVGDDVLLEGAATPWRIRSEEGLFERALTLEGQSAGLAPLYGPTPGAPQRPVIKAKAELVIMDLPPHPLATIERQGPIVAAHVRPWQGGVELYVGADEMSAEARLSLKHISPMGEVISGLNPHPEGRWDEGAVLDITLYDGVLQSRPRGEVLAGANGMIIETQAGWGWMGFGEAALIAPGQWRLRSLLRYGPATGSIAPQARCVIVGPGLGELALADFEVFTPLKAWAVHPGKGLHDVSTRQVELIYHRLDRAPLAPVHLGLSQVGDQIRAHWVRRARLNAEDWAGAEIVLVDGPERYRVRLETQTGQSLYVREVDTTSLSLSLSELDTGALDQADTLALVVAQISAIYGSGHEARAIFNWPLSA
ncbi:baseplate multidomain protein megatron [Woodsholea maritima]|uniref:baseplate multidomain protein megatron n=1 Tax=Woodsholea maritima TaxID=240237 RepID=UPI000360DF91|nr:glycoside hydrolase TIM-barrel-like domain-containing protein [Woodsholea maritima]